MGRKNIIADRRFINVARMPKRVFNQLIHHLKDSDIYRSSISIFRYTKIEYQVIIFLAYMGTKSTYLWI